MSGFTAYPQRDSQMVAIPTSSKDTNYGSSLVASFRVAEIGGEKSGLARAIVNFDISPLSSRTLSAAKMIVVPTVTDAQVTAIISRCTRPADWVESEVTWNSYKSGSSWTDQGGDFDDTGPPASVNFTTHFPQNTDHEITGLLAFADDALDNRSGIVSLILRLDEEDPDPANTEGEVIKTRERAPVLFQPRFVVEHDGAPILNRERGFMRGVQRGVSRGV